MKRKTRTIVVDGQSYQWSVSRPNCDGDDGALLRIWGNGSVIYESVVPFDVTPAIVKCLIEIHMKCMSIPLITEAFTKSKLFK